MVLHTPTCTLTQTPVPRVQPRVSRGLGSFATPVRYVRLESESEDLDDGFRVHRIEVSTAAGIVPYILLLAHAFTFYDVTLYLRLQNYKLLILCSVTARCEPEPRPNATPPTPIITHHTHAPHTQQPRVVVCVPHDRPSDQPRPQQNFAPRRQQSQPTHSGRLQPPATRTHRRNTGPTRTTHKTRRYGGSHKPSRTLGGRAQSTGQTLPLLALVSSRVTCHVLLLAHARCHCHTLYADDTATHYTGSSTQGCSVLRLRCTLLALHSSASA
jgi:hypothetical protein